MNTSQKDRIKYLRGKGESYAAISTALGVSENTVKSFCRRNSLGTCRTAVTKSGDSCANCRLPLTHTPGAKKKRFCSDRCRMAWWNAHPEAVNRKAVHDYTCQACGKRFTAYGNTTRMYCSRTCYGRSRAAHHE